MKANKILIIIQLSMMYLSQLLMLIGVLQYETEELQHNMGYFLMAGLIVAIVVAVLSMGLLVPSFISIFKKNNEDMTKFTMIIKLAAIPWYIVNFVVCSMVILGMLNPFFLMGIPLFAFIFVSTTYINMLAVSANNIGVIISELITHKIKSNGLLIVGMIFHFMFCLDVLGAIFTYVNYRKSIKE